MKRDQPSAHVAMVARGIERRFGMIDPPIESPAGAKKLFADGACRPVLIGMLL